MLESLFCTDANVHIKGQHFRGEIEGFRHRTGLISRLDEFFKGLFLDAEVLRVGGPGVGELELDHLLGASELEDLKQLVVEVRADEEGVAFEDLMSLRSRRR